MKQVGVYDAKTHLPKLIDDVEKGETVVITRHGRPVARLVPVRRGQKSVAEVIEALMQFRNEHTLDGATIRELIQEGRRH